MQSLYMSMHGSPSHPGSSAGDISTARVHTLTLTNAVAVAVRDVARITRAIEAKQWCGLILARCKLRADGPRVQAGIDVYQSEQSKQI
jgi:hypothetical protein